MTQALSSQINELTLRELSLEAAKLWYQIEEATELGEEDKVEELISQLVSIQDGTEAKIDAIAWVVDQLNLDLENWEDRKQRTAELHDKIISRRKTQLEQIKRSLIYQHSVGLIPEKNVGREREIEIRDNPPKVAKLLVEVDDKDFPSEFRSIHYKANNKAILEAHKAGQDVSDLAEITVGKQVRFKVKSSKKGKN